MKKLIICIIAILPFFSSAQRVGVNTTFPSASLGVTGNETNVPALKVEHATGNAVEVFVPFASSTGIGLRIDYNGTGRPFQIINFQGANSASLSYLENNGLGRMMELVNKNVTNDKIVFHLDNKGMNHSMRVQSTAVDNIRTAIEAEHYGLGRAMDLINSNVSNTSTTLFVRNFSETTNVSVGFGLYVWSDAARASYFTNKSGGFNSCGVYARNDTPDGIGIASAGLIASDGGQADNTAIYAYGDIAGSSKSFIIDHPIDPANKYLKHFSIESDEVLLIYRGQAILDENGKAYIELKDYQKAISKNITYSLTPIGSPTIFYVEEEVDEAGLFVIAGDKPGAKVNWTIYAERDDAYFKAYPSKKVIEIEKTEETKGFYIHPVAHGKTTKEGLDQPAIIPREEQKK